MCPQTEPPSTITHRGKLYTLFNVFARKHQFDADKLREDGTEVRILRWESRYAIYTRGA